MGAVPAVRRRPVGLSTGRWAVVRAHGDAAVFHGRSWPSPVAPTVWVFDVDRPALVLGSTQSQPMVDGDRLAASGIEVVRRHSGGGAVLLRPGQVVWVEVLVPAGDRVWERDVNRSFLWLGQVWADALAQAGVHGAVVHDGPLVTTPWSPLVCFAGLGPGEVTLGGRKVVGMSSRRRREGALFQCAALLEWDAAGTSELLGVPSDVLADVAAGTGVPAEAVEGALLDRLSRT